jgi:Ca2+-transporting ATPase
MTGTRSTPSATPSTSSSNTLDPDAVDDVSVRGTCFTQSGTPSTASTDTLGADAPKGHVMPEAEPIVFTVAPNMLTDLVASKSLVQLQALGGTEGLAFALQTDPKAGLSLDETCAQDLDTGNAKDHFLDPSRVLLERRLLFGTNRLPDRPIKSIFRLMLDALSDKILVLLSCAAVVSLALGLYQAFCQPHGGDRPSMEYLDGLTIMLAVVIVVVVGSVNDYQKERQFARLTKKVRKSLP